MGNFATARYLRFHSFRRGAESDQSGLVGLRVFEADDLQRQRLLHFGHVGLARRLQQGVTFELVCTEQRERSRVSAASCPRGVASAAAHSQVSLSLSSGVGAMSTALLLWQLSRVGSAPWLNSREHTSTRFLDAASCSGVNCHRSMAFTQAPCCTESHRRGVTEGTDEV